MGRIFLCNDRILFVLLACLSSFVVQRRHQSAVLAVHGQVYYDNIGNFHSVVDE
jgi:hypothetical protein